MRKAFICPTKYVQGEDELLNLGYFVRTFVKISMELLPELQATAKHCLKVMM